MTEAPTPAVPATAPGYPPYDPAVAARERAQYHRMQLVQLLAQSGTRSVEQVIEDTRTLEKFVNEAGA